MYLLSIVHLSVTITYLLLREHFGGMEGHGWGNVLKCLCFKLICIYVHLSTSTLIVFINIRVFFPFYILKYRAPSWFYFLFTVIEQYFAKTAVILYNVHWHCLPENQGQTKHQKEVKFMCCNILKDGSFLNIVMQSANVQLLLNYQCMVFLFKWLGLIIVIQLIANYFVDMSRSTESSVHISSDKNQHDGVLWF